MKTSLLRASLLAILMAALQACPAPDPAPAPDPVATPGQPVPGPAAPAKNKVPTVTITTPIGSDTKAGFVDGKGTQAQFSYPYRMVIDKHDNLYVIDQLFGYYGGSVIRKVDPAGNVTTFAKGLYSITDLCVDPRDGVTLYAIECGDVNNVPNGIFRISSSGVVTRLSGGPDPDGGFSWGYKDGPLATAKFHQPMGIVMNKDGLLYIGDELNHAIRQVDLVKGTVSTLAGGPAAEKFCDYIDGKGTNAKFCTTEDLTLDEAGNLYVPDWGNHAVRKITPDGTVSTYLGLSTGYTPDGPRTSSGIYQPYRLEYDAVNKQMFVVVNTGGGLKMVASNDYLYNLRTASTDYADKSPGARHGFYSLAVTSKGEIYALDQYNHCIRKLSISWQ
jgi:hypothetical protein